MRKNVGIYVDVPNLWEGTKDSDVKPDPKAIIKYGASFGEVKIARAYLKTPRKNAAYVLYYRADWQEGGFEVEWRRGNGKNGGKKDVDALICPQMIRHLYKENIDVFVLVSGDSDFEESVKIIKKEGKTVIIIPPTRKCAAHSLIESADKHIYYRDLM